MIRKPNLRCLAVIYAASLFLGCREPDRRSNDTESRAAADSGALIVAPDVANIPEQQEGGVVQPPVVHDLGIEPLCIVSSPNKAKVTAGDTAILRLGGCISGGLTVTRTPTVHRVNPHTWNVDGHFEFAPGGRPTPDCPRQKVVSIGPLSAGHHLVRTEQGNLEFDVPFVSQVCNPRSGG